MARRDGRQKDNRSSSADANAPPEGVREAE
jgi:hypothetical protein